MKRSPSDLNLRAYTLPLIPYKAYALHPNQENDEPVHWFEKEHELYDAWARQGKLTQYS